MKRKINSCKVNIKEIKKTRKINSCKVNIKEFKKQGKLTAVKLRKISQHKGKITLMSTD